MRQVIPLLLVAILPACGGKWLTGIDSDYPAHWPKLVKLADGDCPDLSGTWENHGRYTSHGGWERLLSYRLTGSVTEPDRVEIMSGPGVVRIAFAMNRDGSAKADKSLRAGADYVCRDGAVWLNPRVQSHAEGLGGYRAQTTFGLRKAVDGNLIGEERLTSVGALLWVVPMIGWQTSWYRWWPPQ